MSRASSHCILPSCPPSSRREGRRGGDREGQGWDRAPRPGSAAGCLRGAWEPPDSGLPGNRQHWLLWPSQHLDSC